MDSSDKIVVSKKTISVWISKYALTKGVFEETVSQNEDRPTMVSVVGAKYPRSGNKW